jgi:hypothetical protein
MSLPASSRLSRWAIPMLLAAACHSASNPGAPGAVASVTPAPAPVPAAAPPGVASVTVTLNGRSASPNSVCERGLFVATRVANLAARPLTLQRLTVGFQSLSDRCVSHTAQIEPVVNRTLAGGAEDQISVFDAAGTLCAPPTGGVGCSWRAAATVTTDVGFVAGVVDFATTSEGRFAERCDRTPVIFTPANGEVVSGVVAVTASVPESSTCVNSARTTVRVYTEVGIIVATHGPFDLGEVFEWDTRLVPNGRYGISGTQNCCGIEGSRIMVTVRN